MQSNYLLIGATITLSALMPLLALAQSEPAQPRLQYRSVLADYVPYREVDLADWGGANDTVERLKGHMGHVKPPVQEPKGALDADTVGVRPTGPGERQP